jgi:GNAT superfamily N-acetyltransferase
MSNWQRFFQAAARIRPVEPGACPEAAALLEAAYAAERESSPLLPARLLGGGGEAARRIEACIPNGAVAAYGPEGMAGFMAVSAVFPFKGQTAALVGEWAHAALPGDSAEIHRSLYAALGELLRGRGIRLHIVAHFEHDLPLCGCLFDLGFGTFLMERLRDLSPVPGAGAAAVRREEDWQSIRWLEEEHMRYYRGSPIFLVKDSSPAAAAASLEEYRGGGNALFVHDDGGGTAGYFVAGPCRGEDTGRLLRRSGSAQVLTAYCRPRARGRGAGAALLQACVDWARDGGYERLFVEHESANPLGARFWGRHFSPYLRFSMRYVEDA